jgi:uncharacterized protein
VRAASRVAARMAAAVWVVLLSGAATAPAAAAKDVPYLSGRVVDEAGLLSAAARQRIEGQLAALEQQTGDQVAVLTVASLGGEPLEEYSVKVAQTWKLGQKGKDNGLLLLIARDERRMRIEVGYGLEGQLTDLQSREILDDVIRPRFKEGDFDGGVERGVDAIVKVLHGQPLPPPRPASSGTKLEDMPPGQRVLFTLIFGSIFILVVGTFSVIAVASHGFVGWFLYLFLTPFYLAFPTAIVGPLAGVGLTALWLIGFPILRHTLGSRGLLTPPAKGHHRGGFWGFVGGIAGGSAGGGSFGGGGGGFSGGGGGFGGGGASGGW